jgi:serine-type D-Ala-D-Ala carboxypeptidase (penicillin-binding protein 5/6)
MRTAISALLVALLLCSRALAAPPDYPPNGITCRAYLVYNMTTDEVVTQHNPHVRQPIASLTKLMTAIITEEDLRFDGRYRLSDGERKVFETEYMRADKMLEMMMVCSNNKMCRVVSRLATNNPHEFNPLDEERFVARMNQRAQQMGLRNTRFATSSGLPGGEQYSTMQDVLVMLRTAWSYPRVRAAMSMQNVDLGGKHYKGTLAQLYARHPGLVGGKTGYTKAAGRCLALVYRARGQEYAIITFNSSGVKKSFRDAELLLKHCGLYDGPIGEWK